MSVTYESLREDPVGTKYLLVKCQGFFSAYKTKLSIIIKKTMTEHKTVIFTDLPKMFYSQGLDSSLTNEQIMYKLTPKLAKLYDVK